MNRWTRVSQAIGGLAALVGVVHVGVAEMEYEGFGFDALWFVGSGVAVMLIGALTWLAGSPRSWPALRAVAISANVAGLLMGLCFSEMSEWQQPQGPVLVVLFALGAISVFLAARRAPA